MATRYLVRRVANEAGDRFMTPLEFETDSREEAYREMNENGGYVLDRARRTITDKSAECCTFDEAGEYA